MLLNVPFGMSLLGSGTVTRPFRGVLELFRTAGLAHFVPLVVLKRLDHVSVEDQCALCHCQPNRERKGHRSTKH